MGLRGGIRIVQISAKPWSSNGAVSEFFALISPSRQNPSHHPSRLLTLYQKDRLLCCQEARHAVLPEEVLLVELLSVSRLEGNLVNNK